MVATRKIRVEENAARMLRELAQAATLAGPALRPVGHDELIASIVETARSVFRAGACSLAILDPDGEHLVFHVAAGGSDTLIGQRIPVGSGIAGWVVASGQSVSVADVGADPRFSRDVAESTSYVPTSIVALPLETERRMLGVIEILDATERVEDMELMARFARQAALALENAQVFDGLGRSLLAAAAEALAGTELEKALRRLGDDPLAGTSDLELITASFLALTQLGEAERTAAAELLDTYLRHARRRAVGR